MSSEGADSGGGSRDLPEMTFADLSPSMRAAADRAGWTKLMPVQAQSIPYVLARRDLMVQSRTGSGKTGAFVLPILDRVDPSKKECQALILVPTRELAQQVANEAAMLAGDSPVRTVAVYGGVRYRAQLDAFKQGAHVVVGTPGRVLDHLLRKSLSLQGLEVLVFDEADRMLSMGFYPDMKRVQSYLPKRRINGYMYSATYPPHVIHLAQEFLRDPETLSLSTDHVHVTDTEHVYYCVDAMKKDRCLLRIIEIENPSSAIIFCNTKVKVGYVAAVLQNFGYDADALTSELTQGAREHVLNRVRDGKLRFLVATDVAARGLDIPDLSHVIQYEPPEDPEAYVHRAGRTGRAGASGEAITLVASMEELEIKRISKRFEIDMQLRPTPTEEDVEAIVAERVTTLLEARLRAKDSLQMERMQRFVALGRNLGQIEGEAALLAMLLDDYYQETLHAPPVPPGGHKPAPPRRDEGGGGSRDRQGGGGRGRDRSDGQGGGGRRRRRR